MTLFNSKISIVNIHLTGNESWLTALCSKIGMHIFFVPVEHRAHVPDRCGVGLCPDTVQEATINGGWGSHGSHCAMPLPAAALHTVTPRALQLPKQLLICAPQVFVE